MMTQRTFTMDPYNMTCRAVDELVNSVFNTVARPAIRGRADRQRTDQMFVPFNLWEDENNLILECELPGFAINDIEISIVKNALTISGTRQFSFPENANVHLRERLGDRFSRSIQLPLPVDADQAAAHLEHGVLRVTLPKAQQARPRKIEVRSA